MPQEYMLFKIARLNANYERVWNVNIKGKEKGLMRKGELGFQKFCCRTLESHHGNEWREKSMY